MKDAIVRAADPVWGLIGRIVPKDAHRIAINAFPDYDDTTRALVEAVRGSGHQLSILTCRKDSRAPAWATGRHVESCYRYSAAGVMAYHRARTVLFTHGCFSAWRLSPNQTVVNVWHGMPLKRIGLLDGKSAREVPRFHYTIASDERFQGIIAAAFGVDPARVLVAEHPRIDVLRNPPADFTTRLPPHRRLAAWLPTYRASVEGDVRVDGDDAASIFAPGSDLSRVDELLAKEGVLCVVKPHPMAKVEPDALKRYRSLVLMDDAALAARELSLYQLLAGSDLLITDVSSVYFDYKLLGRPTVLYCPDLQAYGASRGFVAPIETLVSEPMAQTEDELIRQLERAIASLGHRKPAGHRGEMSATARLLQAVGAS